MSQREALLAGAKKCLVEKGYGRTTARDIAAASGANLGSIGYHFGSKDRLMSMAALELTDEWGSAVESAVRHVGGETPLARLSALVAELARQLPASSDLQSAGLQTLAQAGFDDELRRELAAAQTGARCALAAVVLDVPEVAPGSEEERGVGFVVYSLVTGLVAQALVDQDTVREPDLLARAVRALT